MAKGISVPCVSIRLLPGGNKQEVIFELPANPATSVVGGVTVVNPSLIKVVMTADPADNYSVGKTYTITIT